MKPATFSDCWSIARATGSPIRWPSDAALVWGSPLGSGAPAASGGRRGCWPMRRSVSDLRQWILRLWSGPSRYADRSPKSCCASAGRLPLEGPWRRAAEPRPPIQAKASNRFVALACLLETKDSISAPVPTDVESAWRASRKRRYLQRPGPSRGRGSLGDHRRTIRELGLLER